MTYFGDQTLHSSVNSLIGFQLHLVASSFHCCVLSQPSSLSSCHLLFLQTCLNLLKTFLPPPFPVHFKFKSFPSPCMCCSSRRWNLRGQTFPGFGFWTRLPPPVGRGGQSCGVPLPNFPETLQWSEVRDGLPCGDCSALRIACLFGYTSHGSVWQKLPEGSNEKQVTRWGLCWVSVRMCASLLWSVGKHCAKLQQAGNYARRTKWRVNWV